MSGFRRGGPPNPIEKWGLIGGEKVKRFVDAVDVLG